MPEIALDRTFAVNAAGTDSTFTEVPSRANGSTYLNVDSASDDPETIIMSGLVGVRGSSKTKGSVVIDIPIVDETTGVVRHNTLRIQVSNFPEDMTTVLTKQIAIAIELLNNSDYANLWKYGQNKGY